MRRMATMLAAAALTGCQPAPPEVDDAWVRLNAVTGRPAAAYFTVEGGERSETVVAMRAAGVGRVELHESMAMGMRPIAELPLPAGQEVHFAPGGRHAMLFDVAPTVRTGQTIALTFELGDGTTMSADAKVLGPADPAP